MITRELNPVEKQIENELTYSRKHINRHIESYMDDTFKLSVAFAIRRIMDKYQAGEFKDNPITALLHNTSNGCLSDMYFEVFKITVSGGFIPIQLAINNIMALGHNKSLLETVRISAYIEFVIQLAEENVLDIQITESNDLLMLSLPFKIPRSLEVAINKYMYLPPLIVKPLVVHENYDNAYYTIPKHVINGSPLNQHNKQLSLDVCNIANGIPLSIDESILLNYEETPNKPLNTRKKRKQFNIMAQASKQVYQMILDSGNVFHNTHSFDSRGRFYSNGYHLHIQSTEYKKALINFAQEEIQ